MKIQILHLPNGLHYFESLIKRGSLHFAGEKHFPNDIEVIAELNKFEKNINCKIKLDTLAKFQCDRCLKTFMRKHREVFELLFHSGKNDFSTDEEDVILVAEDKKDINLLPYIEENLLLSIPMKILCKDDCKGICPHCGRNLNTENCICVEKSTDPRLEKLRSLLQ